MGSIILVTGGARSGKSAIAEGRTLSLGSPAVYIATAQAFDAEMAERIAAHQARRGEQWHTHAEPLDLCGALELTDGVPRLVDCLTLWLTNLILAGHDWRSETARLVETLGRQASPVILVTNEVGAGIVPENRLARVFRDAAGTVNQEVAKVADEVILAVCGLSVKVK
jgi:adenosylcobinamide kinase/adenosylcobinamide-phosphate guanylyltransferase